MNFVSSVIFSSFSRIISLVAGVILSIILARVLGPHGQGVYSLIVSFPMMLVSVTNLGIGRSLIYHIGKYPDNIDETIRNSIFLLIIISFLSMIIGWFLVIIFKASVFKEISYAYLFISLLFIPFYLFAIQFFDAIFLAFNRILEFNLISTCRSILNLFIISFFLILFKNKILGAILGSLFSLQLAFVFSFLLYKKSGKSFSINYTKHVVKKILSLGIKFHLNSIFAILFLRIDIYIINYFLNPIAVGFYTIAVNIAEKLWILSQSIAIIFYPKAVSMEKEKKDSFTILVTKITLALTFLGALILFIFSEEIILLVFSNKYKPSIVPFQILLIGIIALSASRILSNDIDSRGKPMLNTWITFFVLVANIILNIVLIPRYGISGAAWATSISYVLNLLLKTIVFVKLTGINWQQLIFINKKERQIIASLLNNLANHHYVTIRRK